MIVTLAQVRPEVLHRRGLRLCAFLFPACFRTRWKLRSCCAVPGVAGRNCRSRLTRGVVAKPEGKEKLAYASTSIGGGLNTHPWRSLESNKQQRRIVVLDSALQSRRVFVRTADILKTWKLVRLPHAQPIVTRQLHPILPSPQSLYCFTPRSYG